MEALFFVCFKNTPTAPVVSPPNSASCISVASGRTYLALPVPLLLHARTKTTGGHGLQASGGEGGVGGQRSREGTVQRRRRVHPPRPGRRPGDLFRRPAPRGRLGGNGRLDLLGGAPAAVLRRLGADRAGAEPSLLRPVREGAGVGGAPVPAGVLRVPLPVGRTSVQHAGEGGLNHTHM